MFEEAMSNDMMAAPFLGSDDEDIPAI